MAQSYKAILTEIRTRLAQSWPATWESGRYVVELDREPALALVGEWRAELYRAWAAFGQRARQLDSDTVGLETTARLLDQAATAAGRDHRPFWARLTTVASTFDWWREVPGVYADYQAAQSLTLWSAIKTESGDVVKEALGAVGEGVGAVLGGAGKAVGEAVSGLVSTPVGLALALGVAWVALSLFRKAG